MSDIVIDTQAPLPGEYNQLRVAVGWSSVDEAVVGRALSATLMHSNARCNGTLVGHGRLVGDGALYVYLQDVMVAPPYQRCGVGRMIVTPLLAEVAERCRAGTFLGLLAVIGTEPFYERLGFTALTHVNTPMEFVPTRLKEG